MISLKKHKNLQILAMFDNSKLSSNISKMIEFHKKKFISFLFKEIKDFATNFGMFEILSKVVFFEHCKKP